MRRSVRVFAPAIGNSARSGVRTPPPRRTPGSGVRTPDLAELRSEEHTSELQSLRHLVCRLLLGKEKHTSELQSLRHLVCRLLLEKKISTSTLKWRMDVICMLRLLLLACCSQLSRPSATRSDSCW